MNTLASATLQYVMLLSCSEEDQVDPRFAEKNLMPLMQELEAADATEKLILANEASTMLAYMETQSPKGPTAAERTILEFFIGWAEAPLEE